MNLDRVVKILEDDTAAKFKVSGTSMTPRVKDGEYVTVRKLRADEDPRKGDIVLARVEGSLYLHLVSAIEKEKGRVKRVQISNNHGHVNGWTPRDKVYALLVKLPARMEKK